MKIITVEEHISGAPIDRYLAKYALKDAPYVAAAHGKGRPYEADPVLFGDTDRQRIADMDKNGISVQILSCPSKSQLLPKGEAPQIVSETNDFLAETVKKHPDRYGAFALLPWSNVEAAVKEVERIKKLGFNGVLLSGRATSGDAFLDDKQFIPVLEVCAELELPIYIHPAAPLNTVQTPYYGGLGEEVSARFSLHGWGWHNEAGIQILRTILAGRFDMFPKLQFVAGHWGEMLPFFLSRIDQSMPQTVTKLNRTVTDTFKENIYVTPSGIFDYPQLKFCVEVLGAERIIHSVDCPFISNAGAVPFIENAPLSDTDKELIAYKNAEKLFKL